MRIFETNLFLHQAMKERTRTRGFIDEETERGVERGKNNRKKKEERGKN